MLGYPQRDITGRRESARQRQRFEKVRRAELQYRTQLRKVARQIGDITRALHDQPEQLERMLYRYAELIDPWANAVARRMLVDVMRRDEKVWNELGKTMGRAVRQEILTAPTGQLLRDLQAEQVSLIRSIPVDAAQRVHELAVGTIYSSARYPEVSKEIMRTGLVSRSKADLIARTEVSRASTNLTQSRATHIGSAGYYWRTAKDEQVRPSHRKMEGKFVHWNNPPTLDNLTGHAGALPNCRCYPEVTFPDTI